MELADIQGDKIYKLHLYFYFYSISFNKRRNPIMSPEKEKAIRKHFDTYIRKFKKQALEIALHKDYPFIIAMLNKNIIDMQQRSMKNIADIQKEEVIFTYMK